MRLILTLSSVTLQEEIVLNDLETICPLYFELFIATLLGAMRFLNVVAVVDAFVGKFYQWRNKRQQPQQQSG